MKKVVVALKRWWIVILIFTLALSLTSCSRRSQPLEAGDEYGYAACDGTMGSFDVYVFPSSTYGLYEISIIPIDLDEPGDIVRITLANNAPTYKSMLREVVLDIDEEIFVGIVNESDLMNFDQIVITPYDTGAPSFLEQDSQKDAFCELPIPEMQDLYYDE